MLPPFLLTATLNGEYREFVACDVPTGVFMGHDFQEVMPGMECFGKEAEDGQRNMMLRMESWSDAMLTRVIADPVLTLDDVRMLGTARDELVVGYLWAVGWEQPKDALRRVSPRALSGEWIAAPTPDLEVLRSIPGPNMKRAIRELATKSRVAPSVVWSTWAISEFIWNWRVILQDELQRKGGAPVGTDLMDQVGREAA